MCRILFSQIQKESHVIFFQHACKRLCNWCQLLFSFSSVFNVVDFPTLKAVGYTFDGWSETTDGVKISFELFTVTTTRTFYARWNVINNNTNFSFTELSRVYGIKGVQISGIPDSISISEYMPNINKVSNSQTAFIGDFKGTGP